MKISSLGLVITAHNCAEFIERAVESVFSQKIPYGRVLVIDDASADETPEKLRKLREKFPSLEVVRNKSNLERCESRNLGAKLLETDYVCFLDCDDLQLSDYTAAVLNSLKTLPDAIYQNPKGFISPKGEIKEKRVPKESFPKLLFSGRVGYPSGSCFKRKTFLKLGGYRDEFLMREDWEIFLRFFLKGYRVEYIPRGNYLIGVHGGRTSSKNPLFLEATLKVFRTYFERTPEEFKGLMVHHVAVECFRFKRRRCGFKFLKELFLKYPKTLKDKRRMWELLKRIPKI
jgi:glycosyltransferase involved in cell wall biosynthesis